MNTFWFGNQKITTKVYMMAPADPDEIAIDVTDYIWEEDQSWIRKPSSTRYGATSSPSSRPTNVTSAAASSPKFLTLTSFGMFVGNVWILAKSALHRQPSFPACTPSRRWTRLPVGGVKIFNYPNRG